MRIEPYPESARISVGVLDVCRAAVSVAAGGGAAAMQRISGSGLVAGRQALAIIIPESAQDRPAKAGRVHGEASSVKQLAEVAVHSRNHIVCERHFQTRRRGTVLPGKISAAIVLDRRTLVDAPQILIDLVHSRLGRGYGAEDHARGRLPRST